MFPQLVTKSIMTAFNLQEQKVGSERSFHTRKVIFGSGIIISTDNNIFISPQELLYAEYIKFK